MIADGYLGDILSVDIAAQTGFIDRESPLHWRHNRDLSGFNSMQMGILYEYVMRWVGPAASVRSITRVNVKSRADDSGARRHISVPDFVEVLAELESGPVLHLRVSMVSGLGPADAVWMFGTEGTLHLDMGANVLSAGRRGDDALSPVAIAPEKQGGWRVEEEFISAIRGHEEITPHELRGRRPLHGVHRGGRPLVADGRDDRPAAVAAPPARDLCVTPIAVDKMPWRCVDFLAGKPTPRFPPARE